MFCHFCMYHYSIYTILADEKSQLDSLLLVKRKLMIHQTNSIELARCCISIELYRISLISVKFQYKHDMFLPKICKIKAELRMKRA